MKVSLLYELEMPKPWSPTAERDCYMQALEQIKLADEMGFDIVWEVEHHFLTEYSHSSAPEVFDHWMAPGGYGYRYRDLSAKLDQDYWYRVQVYDEVGQKSSRDDGKVLMGASD